MALHFSLLASSFILNLAYSTWLWELCTVHLESDTVIQNIVHCQKLNYTWVFLFHKQSHVLDLVMGFLNHSFLYNPTRVFFGL